MEQRRKDAMGGQPGKAGSAPDPEEAGTDEQIEGKQPGQPAPTESKRRGRGRPEPEARPLVRASAKYVRVAPRKARLVADQVRGMHIEEARALLDFSPRSVATDIRKVIDSAAANAESNHELISDEMRVAVITVDEGPIIKRFRPRALGRATRIDKRTSHISVALSPEE